MASSSYWEQLSALEAQLAPFRDAALDRWHRKTLLSSGRSAMKSNLRALNQSISQQVAGLMVDLPRAVEVRSGASEGRMVERRGG